MVILNTIFSVLAFLAGAIIVAGTLTSAIRSFVLARSARDAISSLVFISIRRVFESRIARITSYQDRDRIMAFFAPISLIALPFIWLTFFTMGYMLMYWALGVRPLYNAYILSGSSILTLGFASEHANPFVTTLEFTQASLGLLVVALVVSYLPTMYSAFSRRETVVTLLEVRAGSPPSAVEMIIRAHRIRGLEYMEELWVTWETWFADVEESHTTLAPLVFFRSTKAQRSWVTASGAVLDAAALYASTLDRPRSPQAELCIRAGYLALRYIGDYFSLEYPPDPRFPEDGISISEYEFYEVYEQLKAAGVPVKANKHQCWMDFAGWRVNYDAILLRLAALTMAPYAPWSSDRSKVRQMRGEIKGAARE